MQTDVRIRHHDYPSKLRGYVSRKLTTLATIFDGTLSTRAVLERQRGQHCVELVSSVRPGHVLVVDARGENVHAALDEALDRMRRVLGKHRDKLRERRK